MRCRRWLSGFFNIGTDGKAYHAETFCQQGAMTRMVFAAESCSGQNQLPVINLFNKDAMLTCRARFLIYFDEPPLVQRAAGQRSDELEPSHVYSRP